MPNLFDAVNLSLSLYTYIYIHSLYDLHILLRHPRSSFETLAFFAASTAVTSVGLRGSASLERQVLKSCAFRGKSDRKGAGHPSIPKSLWMVSISFFCLRVGCVFVFFVFLVVCLVVVLSHRHRPPKPKYLEPSDCRLPRASEEDFRLLKFDALKLDRLKEPRATKQLEWCWGVFDWPEGK